MQNSILKQAIRIADLLYKIEFMKQKPYTAKTSSPLILLMLLLGIASTSTAQIKKTVVEPVGSTLNKMPNLAANIIKYEACKNVAFAVKNTTKNDAGSFKVDVVNSDKQVMKSFEVVSLKANESVWFTFEREATTDTWSIVVNPDGRIPELTKRDNIIPLHCIR
jgi:hypothetical protein